MTRILEIACFNYESAIITAKAGADRIEFCTDFSSGGLTPDLKETEKLIKEIDIPVFVMIRKRGGNFIYTEDEMEDSKFKIQNFKEIGVSGFVFGSLFCHPEQPALNLFQGSRRICIDKKTNEGLIHSANGLPCTFHRAFDHTENLFESLEDIIDCGFTRILCSGGKGNAIDNLETLKKLNEAAKGRISIMPGGGVRSSNIEKLLETGCNEFHSSGILSGEMANESEIRKLKKILNP
jgi:copper homeostasis protein